jgi:uncharacterized membrane protein YgaE (UPF0421/DUF939 family)
VTYERFFEDAAERSRVSMRARWERVRVNWRTLVQVGLATGLAWVIAHSVVGHKAPFFAPTSAIITLGLTVSERGRRAFELAFGVSLGIAIADLLILVIGTGAWQLSLVVMLATATALFVGRGGVLVGQAAVSAVLVTTLTPPSHGISFARALDALVGGSVALLVNALIVPAHPLRTLALAARTVLDELAATLEAIASAIAARDADAAEAALARARGIDELGTRFSAAVATSREMARFAPPRRGTRGRVETYADAAAQVDLAIRNTRVLARGAIRALRLDDNVPPEVAEAVRELERAVRALAAVLAGGAPVDTVREPALHAAFLATSVLERTGNLSVSVLVGQIRSTAVDLLASAGSDHADAADAVQEAAGEALR